MERFSDQIGQNLFDLLPIQKKGTRGPTTHNHDDPWVNPQHQQVRGTPNPEAVPLDAIQTGLRPNLATTTQEPIPRQGSPPAVRLLKGEKGGMVGNAHIAQKMLFQRNDRACWVIHINQL
jgi:hypothetical protein